MSKHSPYFFVRLMGARELEHKLQRIAVSERNAVERGALFTIINEVVVPAIQHETPIGKTRDLVKSVGYIGGYSKGNSVYGIAGTRNPQGAAGHLVEFGTGPRYKKNGAYCGAMPANHFMQRAMRFVRPIAEQAMAQEIARRIAEAAR